MSRARKPRAKARSKARRAARHAIEAGHVADEAVRALGEHPGSTPRLTGGDVDADWQGAAAVGDEAVGGSVATPDQDVVDELARALGVEQAADAEVQTSGEILRERDRHRWRAEREAAREPETGR